MARGALAAELARARVGMLSVLADHLGCLRALNIWLLDLVADQRAFHVLELVLQARQAAVSFAVGSSTFCVILRVTAPALCWGWRCARLTNILDGCL